MEPVFSRKDDNVIFYIDFSSDDFKLGGSSFAQVRKRVGTETPTVKDPDYFKTCINALHEAIGNDQLLPRHDISEGGNLTAMQEKS